MIEKINKKSIKEFTRFSIVGGLMTLINFVLFYIFIRYLNLTYICSNIISYIIAVILSYYVNVRFTFTYRKQSTKEEYMKFIKYCCMRLVVLEVDSILLFCFVDILNINVYSSKVIITVILFISTFGLSKYILNKE